MKKIIRVISSIALGAMMLVSCEKSDADKYMDEAKRVLTNASGTEWSGNDGEIVYTLRLNTGGTYTLTNTSRESTTARGTYKQNGLNITFEKKSFMSDFYAYIEQGKIADSGLYMTIPIKSVIAVGGSNDMFTLKLYRSLSQK